MRRPTWSFFLSAAALLACCAGLGLGETAPSGPALALELLSSGELTFAAGGSASWSAPLPSSKPLDPQQSKTVGTDVLVNWLPTLQSESCFVLSVSVVVVSASSTAFGSPLMLSNKTWCLTPNSSLDVVAPVLYPISPCQLRQLVKPAGDAAPIFLQLRIGASRSDNALLPWDAAAVFAANASLAVTDTAVDSGWQYDANPLCMTSRYYMRKAGMRCNPVFAITNTSAPSVGVGSLGGCLPDVLGTAIATFSSNADVSQSGVVYTWKAQNVEKGTITVLVELAPPPTLLRNCSSFVRLALKSPADKNQSHIVVAVSLSLLAGLLLFVALIVGIGKYRDKKNNDYVQIQS